MSEPNTTAKSMKCEDCGKVLGDKENFWVCFEDGKMRCVDCATKKYGEAIAG